MKTFVIQKLLIALAAGEFWRSSNKEDNQKIICVKITSYICNKFQRETFVKVKLFVSKMKLFHHVISSDEALHDGDPYKPNS